LYFFIFDGVFLVNHPHGLLAATGGDFLPSPPPWGWSHGFIATPLTVGRIPKARTLPAFSNLVNLCKILEHSPKEPILYLEIKKFHPDLAFNITLSSILAVNITPVPAERANEPPK